LNEANLTDALLVRAVLTRSDLGKAIIDGADFSDAVLDLQQKLVSSSKFYGASSACERLPDCNVSLGSLCHFVSVVKWRGDRFGEKGVQVWAQNLSDKPTTLSL
jgi:hypothetical protein